MTHSPRAVDPVRKDRLKWAALVSVYVHLAAGFLFVGHDLLLPPSSTQVAAPEYDRISIRLVDGQRRAIQAPGVLPEPDDTPKPAPPEQYLRLDKTDGTPEFARYFSAVDAVGQLEKPQTAGQHLTESVRGRAGSAEPRRPSRSQLPRRRCVPR